MQNGRIKDPPDINVHEHSEHSRGFLFKEVDIKISPDCGFHEHYQSEWFRKIKASSQQSCGTDNRTERMTSGTHGADHILLHRAT
jgi:hypothetical protein